MPTPTEDRLRAPFPWSGGKGRWCAQINERLGDDVQTYAEPFAGSMAVLLSRDPARREIITDTSSLLVNAWRAMAAAPLEVAEWCDWPTFHDDLIARRRYLGAWVAEHAARVQEDEAYFDAKAGGYWIWCMSHAIRGNADMGWSPAQNGHMGPEDVPHMGGTNGSQGVQSTRSDNRRPAIDGGIGGRGVSATRKTARADDRRPNLQDTSAAYAKGVAAHGSGNRRIPNMQDANPDRANGVGAHGKVDRRPPNVRGADGPVGGCGVQAQRTPGTERPNLNPDRTAGHSVQAHRPKDARVPKMLPDRDRGGSGVSAQRPVDERRPRLSQDMATGGGVQAHRRADTRIPKMRPADTGGSGVQAARTDAAIPELRDNRGRAGKGVSAQVAAGGIPEVQAAPGGRGVAAHRITPPGDAMPSLPGDPGGGGVQAHRAGANVPQTVDQPGGQGVQAHRGGAKTINSIPKMQDVPGGVPTATGVQAQRSPAAGNGVPSMTHGEGGPSARGVSAERTAAGGAAGGFPSHERWGPWFEALAHRLKQVIVLNRPWTSAVTPAALAARAGGIVAILLDPPYVTSGRSKLYEADADADEVNRVAREAYEWALEHGDQYRIAYCHTLGSFEFPDGWEVLSKTYTGTNVDARTVDAIAFSPKCQRPGRDTGQLGMFV